MKKEFRQYPDFGRELVFEFSEEKIFGQSSHTKSEMDWTRFTRHEETKELFVLFAPPRPVLTIPKRGFAPGDEDHFRNLLRQKLSGKARQWKAQTSPNPRARMWKNLIAAGIVVGGILFVRWFVPRFVASNGRPPHFNPALRQRLRESEDELAEALPWPYQGPSGIPPCLVLPLEVGVEPAGTPRNDVPAHAHHATRGHAQPDGPVRDCLELVPGGGPLNAAEIYLRTGTPILVQTDLYLPGDPPITFTRVVEPPYYWKRRFRLYLPNEYVTYPTGHRNPYTDQTLWLADTRGVLFDRISKGTGYADAVFAQRSVGGMFYRALEGWNGDGWDLDLPDGRTLVFPESYYARSPQQGALVGLIEPSGASLTMRRDREGNLREVRSSDGRWMKLNYKGPFILSLEDNAGGYAVYSYDSQKRLRSSSDVDGKTLSYRYNKWGELKSVEDEKSGRAVLTFTYDEGWVTSVAAAGRPAYQIHYRTDPRDNLTGIDVRSDLCDHWTVLLRAGTNNNYGYEVHDGSPYKR